MKKMFYFLLLSFCFSISAWCESLRQESQRAAAFFEAGDFSKAAEEYERLLAYSLTDWQVARVMYNLATIFLAQNQLDNAIDYFQKIDPTLLSLPRYGRDYFINLGIAYAQYAKLAFNGSSPSIFIDQQILFTEQALEAFNEAKTVECQVQEKEGQSPFVCLPYPFLEQWIAVARSQLNAFQQEKRQRQEQQAKEKKVSKPVEILQQGIEQASHVLQLLYLDGLKRNEPSKDQQEIKTLQQNMSKEILTFIPISLAEQKNKFEQEGNPVVACQQYPWEQVIPLFYSGFKTAQNVERRLNNSTYPSQEAIFFQRKAIKDWNEALKQLINPPRMAPSALIQDEKVSSPNEIFRLVQEMYLEDQSQQPKQVGELHSW